MVESIDINKILSQHQAQDAQQAKPQPSSIKRTTTHANPLPSLVKSFKQDFVIAYLKNDSDTQSSYFINYQRDYWDYLEKKNTKWVWFRFDSTKQLLAKNKKRAQKQDIRFLVHRFKMMYLNFSKSKHTFIGAHDGSPITSTIDSLQKVSKWLNISSEILHIINVPRKHQKALADYLKILKSILGGSPSKELSDNLTLVLDYFQAMSTDFLSDKNKEFYITNSKKLNPRLNTIFTLKFTPKLVTLTERSAYSATEYKILLDEKKIILNNQSLPNSGLDHLLQKCIKISSDIGNNKADVLETL